MSYDNAYEDTMSKAYGNKNRGDSNPYGNERDAYKSNSNYYNQFGYNNSRGMGKKSGKSIKGSLVLLTIIAIGIVYILYFS